ncbi:MAG: two-component system response regulator [Candidatus Hodarchaeota archaeon]
MTVANNTKETGVSRETLPRLLIVDDDMGILELFRVYLFEIAQYPEKNVEFAKNGYEALKLLELRNKKFFPHIIIIITDFKMLVMDGITFCNQLYLKYNDISNYFVVIFYSGAADGVLEDQTKELFKNIKGIIRYKPYRICSLIDDARILLCSDQLRILIY